MNIFTSCYQFIFFIILLIASLDYGNDIILRKTYELENLTNINVVIYNNYVNDYVLTNKKLKIDILKKEIAPRFSIYSDLDVSDDPNIFILFLFDEEKKEMIYFEINLNLDPCFDQFKYKLFYNLTEINCLYIKCTDFLNKNYDSENYDKILNGQHSDFFITLLRKIVINLMHIIHINPETYYLLHPFNNILNDLNNLKDTINIKEKIENFIKLCKSYILQNNVKSLFEQSDSSYKRDASLISKRFISLGQCKGMFHSYSLSEKKRIINDTSKKWIRFIYKKKISLKNINKFLFAEIQGIKNLLDRFTIFICYFSMCNKKLKSTKYNNICRTLIFVWFYKSYWINDRKQINEFLEVLYYATHPREQKFKSLLLQYDLSLSSTCSFHEMISTMIKRYLFFSLEIKSLYTIDYDEIEKDENFLELSWFLIVHAIGIKFKMSGLK